MSTNTEEDIQWNPTEPVADAVNTVETAAADAVRPSQEVRPDIPPRPATKPKKPKSKGRELPLWLIDSEPPKGTDRWTQWMLYTSLRLYRNPRVPIPDFWGPYTQRIAENHAFIRKESDYSMAIVAIVSVKGGGGKTTTTTWDAAEDSALTNGLTLIVDADSSGTQSASERLSIEKSEANTEWFLTTPEAADKILHHGWVPTSTQVTYFTAKHEPSRVRVLAMDTSDLSRVEMAQVLRALEPATHSVFVDTTPGLKEPNTYGVLDAATVVVVPTIYDNTSALNAAQQTLDTPEYGLRKRLANGDDVILAVHGVELKDFNARYQHEIATRFGLLPRQVSLFPMDKHAYKARPVDREMVSKRYLYALSEHRRRCAVAAIAWNVKYPLEPLPGDKIEEQNSASQPAAEPNGDTSVTQEGSA